MKQSVIREARLGVAATVTFGQPTVTVKQGSVRIVTAAALPIKPAVTPVRTVAAA